MRLIERNQFISVAAVLGLALFFRHGRCDSICPNGITNITGSSGILAYPSSGDYGINETKCWKIEVPETYVGIGYTYSRLDIEVCENNCECDSLDSSSFYSVGLKTGGDCERLSDGYLEYRRLLGNPKGDLIGGTTGYFRFASDGTVHRKGFNLTFIAVSFSGGDKSYLNATEDETLEFGTPKAGIKNYPKDYRYQWFLIVPEGRQVQIDFETFELEESENCKNDYVEFREATIERDGDLDGTAGPILTGRLCGSTKPSTIQSAGNLVWVQFRSNNNATTLYKGFKASFKAGQGRLSGVSNPMTLLFLSAWLVIASKNGVF